MLLSIAFIFLFGLLLGELCGRLHFPKLFGMILAGIFIGPHGLNLIGDSVLGISAEIRRMALLIILIRAGLKLSAADLKKVGRPAVLMCFLPATLELAGMILLAPPLLGLTRLEAAILGAVVAAVSPAVIVPKMIKLIDEGYGTAQAIPQMILAGASVDDVYVIVLFSTFTDMARGGSADLLRFVNVPLSILTGVGVGLLAGRLLALFWGRIHLRDTIKVMITLSAAFLLVTAEDVLPDFLPFASLIAVMSLGLMLKQCQPHVAVRLSGKFDKLWVPAEIFLFVLVGASVAVDYALAAGPRALVLLFGVLAFRMAGVYLCLLKTKLNPKERLFCMLAYTPKATVQAAIGGMPLAMGLPCGEIVLTVSVIAILLTAPLGAFAIEGTYTKFLRREDVSSLS